MDGEDTPLDVSKVEGSNTFDVGRAIDNARWSSRQTLVLVLASLVVVLDGFDNQLLGFSIPQISQEFGVERGAFSWILALGYVGVAIGTASGGLIGDIFGRKYAMIIAVVLFGALTVAASAAPNLVMLGLCRIGAGIGLGMVFPAVASMVAEFTPLRHRSLAVAMSIVCIPVGGLVGGLIAAEVLPTLGWRTLFLLGGIAPMVLAVLLAAVLTESLQFLVARGRGNDHERVRDGLRRLGIEVPVDASFVARENTDVQRGSAKELIGHEYRRDSIALWVAFFFSLLGVFAFYSWGPSLFVDSGFDTAMSSWAISLYNFGGITLAIIAAYVMSRIGSRKTLLFMAMGAGVTGLWLFLAQPSPDGSNALLITQLVLHGGFFAGLQTVLYSLASQVYPSNIRATGVGACGTVGRAGAILASFVGATLLAIGGGVFYLMLAIAGFAVGAALILVRRHTQPVRAAAPAQAVVQKV